MPKRIPDAELTPEQLVKREKRRRYLAANRERIKAQRHDYYLRNAEKMRENAKRYSKTLTLEERIEKNKSYRERHADEISERRKARYAKNPEKYKKRSKAYYDALTPEQKRVRAIGKRDNTKAWIDRNRERVLATAKKYYQENREHKLEYGAKYTQEHAEEIRAHQVVCRREKQRAGQMCPAFMFTEYLRLKENARFVAVYKPKTNLAHLAAKTCGAIKAGDFHMCPICRTPRMHNATMKSVCPMPHVFEFEDAIAQIRKFAKQIVAENKR